MHALKIILVFMLGFALMWAFTLSVRVDALYTSVHNAGTRFSKVVSTGNDIGSHRFSNQFVRIEPALYYALPARRPAFLDQPVEPAPRVNSARKERLVLPGVITFVGLLSVLTLILAGRERGQEHPHQDSRSLVRAAIAVCGGGAVIAIGFLFFRVFLTGIDDALIARATHVGSEAQRYYLAKQTLSMSWPTLVMLYLGIAMLAYPIMTTIGMRIMGFTTRAPQRGDREQESQPSIANRLMNGIFVGCYGLLLTVFLLSPWTNTILGTILSA